MAEGDRALLEPVLVADDSMIQRVARGTWYVLPVEGVVSQGGVGGGGEAFAGTLARTAGRAHRKGNRRGDDGDDGPASCYPANRIMPAAQQLLYCLHTTHPCALRLSAVLCCAGVA